MKLVIVESPAKAKTINKYLGSDYKVIASYGHIRDLPSKDGSVTPEQDFAMNYQISPQSSKHVKEIADLAKRSEAIYLATDPDREGEAISWHVIEALKEKKIIKDGFQIYRIAFNEITKRAVSEAISNPRNIDMDLVNAQQARRALDYLVGFTLSPVLWRKLPGSRSAGRVQSVALRLICEREQQIESFISKEYWDIKCDVLTNKKEAFTARLTHFNNNKLEQFDINNEKQAHEIAGQIEGKKLIIEKIEKKQTKRNPYAPFTTSTLQQEASRKLGFGAKKTMMVAQKLYEGVSVNGEQTGLITYMRTDGVTVSKEAVNASRKLIEKDFGEKYLPSSPRMYTSKAKNAQEAHEAIRPSDVNLKPDAIKKFLDDDQYKLYSLIWKRMIASQMNSAIINQVAVDIKTEDNIATLRANGSSIEFDGHYKLYLKEKDEDKADDDEKMLPVMQEGDNLTNKAVNPEQHFTQPPPRYTEASLVKKLEELGIGRPSTYASIISVLQDREYVKLDKKRFIAESRGRVVTAFLEEYFNKYVEYDFTAHLEDTLDEIAGGKVEWKNMLGDFWKNFKHNIDDVKDYKNSDILEKLDDVLAKYIFGGDGKEEDRKCPTCENGILSLKLGKFGAFVGCSNYPECNYTKQLSTSDNGSEGEGAPELNEPKVLGQFPDTGEDILLKKGPYGHYVQLGHDEESKKPKRSSIQKNINIADVTAEMATRLLSLPRLVGTHPETGKEITADIGRYGPYLKHDGKFTSLKQDDVTTVSLEKAVEVLKNSGKGKNEPLKNLGAHPDSKEDILVYSGRYGPYIKHKKTNASIPKSINIDEITKEQALDILKKKEDKKK